jgi:hypothetical protein
MPVSYEDVARYIDIAQFVLRALGFVVPVCERVYPLWFLCVCVWACLGLLCLCIPLCKPLSYVLPYPLQ